MAEKDTEICIDLTDTVASDALEYNHRNDEALASSPVQLLSWLTDPAELEEVTTETYNSVPDESTSTSCSCVASTRTRKRRNNGPPSSSAAYRVNSLSSASFSCSGASANDSIDLTCSDDEDDNKDSEKTDKITRNSKKTIEIVDLDVDGVDECSTKLLDQDEPNNYFDLTKRPDVTSNFHWQTVEMDRPGQLSEICRHCRGRTSVPQSDIMILMEELISNVCDVVSKSIRTKDGDSSDGNDDDDDDDDDDDLIVVREESTKHEPLSLCWCCGGDPLGCICVFGHDSVVVEKASISSGPIVYGPGGNVSEDSSAEPTDVSVLRLVTLFADSTKLMAGDPFIVTASARGTTLGNDQKNDISFWPCPLAGLARRHLKFSFHGQYYVSNLRPVGGTGPSAAGEGSAVTAINEEVLQPGAMRPLLHGDIISIGESLLLLAHIHRPDRRAVGLENASCADCDSRAIRRHAEASFARRQREEHDRIAGEAADAASDMGQRPTESVLNGLRQLAARDMFAMERLRRAQLKDLKKQFGLANADYEPSHFDDDETYRDRSAARRLRSKGVDDGGPPTNSRHIFWRTERASVNKPISSENRGRQMLEKMGWASGQGLGRDGQGRREPVGVRIRADNHVGLGACGVQVSLDDAHKLPRFEKWAKAKERYKKASGQLE